MGEPSADRDAAEKIIKSRHIEESVPKKGDDVKLGPDSEKSVEAGNNDGKTDYRKRKVNDGKTDATLELTVPKSKVPKYDAEKTDDHFFKGDLNLTDAKNTETGTQLAQEATRQRAPLNVQDICSRTSVAGAVSQVRAQLPTTTVTTALTPVQLAQRISAATALASGVQGTTALTQQQFQVLQQQQQTLINRQKQQQQAVLQEQQQQQLRMQKFTPASGEQATAATNTTPRVAQQTGIITGAQVTAPTIVAMTTAVTPTHLAAIGTSASSATVLTVTGTPLAQAAIRQRAPLTVQEISSGTSVVGQVAGAVSQVRAQLQTTTVTTALTPVQLAQRISAATTLASGALTQQQFQVLQQQQQALINRQKQQQQAVLQQQQQQQLRMQKFTLTQRQHTVQVQHKPSAQPSSQTIHIQSTNQPTTQGQPQTPTQSPQTQGKTGSYGLRTRNQTKPQ